MNFKDELKLQKLTSTIRRVKKQIKVQSCDLYIRLDCQGKVIWEGVYFKPVPDQTRVIQMPFNNTLSYSYISKTKNPA